MRHLSQKMKAAHNLFAFLFHLKLCGGGGKGRQALSIVICTNFTFSKNGDYFAFFMNFLHQNYLFIYNISRCISSHTQTLIIFFYAKIFALLLLHIIILSGIFLLKSKCRPSMVVVLLHMYVAIGL